PAASAWPVASRRRDPAARGPARRDHTARVMSVRLGEGDVGARAGARVLRVLEARARRRLLGPRLQRGADADLLEVAPDRVRDPVGVRLEDAIRDAAVVAGVGGLARSPAEDLGGAGRPVVEGGREWPETGRPVLRLVQAQLRVSAAALPVGRELDQGELI